MIEKLVLHIGDCKTGSTAIQSVLSQQAWSADGWSIAYPTRFNHVSLARSLSIKKLFSEQPNRFGRVQAAFQKSSARVGVLSAEHFEFVGADRTKAALDSYLPEHNDHLQIVGYVRPHADRLLSSFAEMCKLSARDASLDVMFERFEENGRLDYAPRFRRWRELYGDRFVLRPSVRSSLYQQDVVADFLKIALNGAEAKIESVILQNESLPVQDLALMREIHARVRAHFPKINGNFVETYGRNLARLIPAPDKSQMVKLKMHRALAERMIERYMADAKALDDEFFDEPVMATALEQHLSKVVDEPMSLEAKDYFSADTLRYIDAFSHLTGRQIKFDGQAFAKSALPREIR